MKRFERSNRLDTALYKNYLYLLLRLRQQCLRSKITSVARVEIVLLLRFVAGNVDVNTLASKRSELLGNADILRMRRVIHNDSTCVCLRIPVAAITQKRKRRPVAGLTPSHPLLHYVTLKMAP